MNGYGSTQTDLDGTSVTGMVQDADYRWPVLAAMAVPYVVLAALVGFVSNDLQTFAIITGLLALMMTPFVFFFRELYARIPRRASFRLERHTLEFDVPWQTERVPLSGISGVSRETSSRTRSSLLGWFSMFANRDTLALEQKRQRQSWSQDVVVVRAWGEAGSHTWTVVAIDENALEFLFQQARERLADAGGEAPEQLLKLRDGAVREA